MDGNTARQRAAEIRRSLGTSTVQVDDTTLPLASSLGVVTVTQKSGNSETEMAAAVFQALISTLYKAKEKGGNTAEIYNSTRF
jgi:GGDEF domain-containing protein